MVNLGAHDVIVPEAIVRWVDPGELAVDIGSNIGQNASAMACRSGPGGQVVAFEPHPAVWTVLLENLARWARHDIAPIRAEPLALSRGAGSSVLYESDGFPGNQGSASVERPERVMHAHQVATASLDDCFPEETIAVAKLDVEGHEAAVPAFSSAARAWRPGAGMASRPSLSRRFRKWSRSSGGSGSGGMRSSWCA